VCFVVNVDNCSSINVWMILCLILVFDLVVCECMRLCCSCVCCLMGMCWVVRVLKLVEML